MKKFLLILLTALLSLTALARDFTYTYEGKTLTYTVIDEDAKTCKTLEGTYPGIPGPTGNHVSGDLIIPSEVIGPAKYGGGVTTFTVTEIGDYSFRDNNLTSVTLPNTITKIGGRAFQYCYNLTEVIIPNSVTSVGDMPFEWCKGLKKAAYPSSVWWPFKDTYAGADFKPISYPEGSVIENGVIYGDDYKTIYYSSIFLKGNFTVPNSITKIGDYAFRSCGFTSIDCNSVEIIGLEAFSNSNTLRALDIPNITKDISRDPVINCPNLIKVSCPSEFASKFSVVSDNGGLLVDSDSQAGNWKDGILYNSDFSELLFAKLNTSGEVSLPETITAINHWAFACCNQIESLKLASPVAPSLNENSFDNSSYDSVELTIPVNSFGSYPCTVWGKFKSLKIGNLEAKSFNDGTLTYLLNPNDNTAVVTGTSSSYVNIPERFTDDSDPSDPQRYYVKGIGYKALNYTSSISFNSRAQIETIGEYAFSNSYFSSLTLPETVTSIGEGAFYHCYNLTSITIPEQVTAIAPYTFYNCNALTEYNLPNTIETIGEYAFSFSDYRTNTLGDFTMPQSVKYIGENAFLNRPLDKVIMTDLEAWCSIEFANNDSNPGGWALEGLWINDSKLVDLVIPDGVEEIKPFAFVINITNSGWNNNYMRCEGQLQSVVIPNSVKSIGQEAFNGNGFSVLTIPASVNYIGNQAFTSGHFYINASDGGNGWVKYDQYVYKLTTFELASGTTPITIEADAFMGLKPNFDNASNTSTYSIYNSPINFMMGRPINALPDGFKENTSTLIIGNTITEIPDDFWTSGKLSSLTLGNSVKSIGANAFKNNKLGYYAGKTEIVLSPSVETIGESAFQGNGGQSIIMGANVKTICGNAFDGCGANTVSITAPIPPTAPNTAFSNYTGKLYLQGKQAIDDYYNAYTCWDRFDSYEMIEPTEIKLEGEKKFSGKPGDTFQVTASLLPADVTLPQLFYRSTNPEIASVDHQGLVTINADLDEAMATAEGDNDGTHSCKIIVESLYANGPVAEIEISDISTGIEDIANDEIGNDQIDYNAPVEIYTLSGVRVVSSRDNLASGIYIVRQGTKVAKIAVK